MTDAERMAKVLHDTDPSHAGCERGAEGHGPSGWTYYLRWAEAVLEGASSEARGIRFRVETACEGYANLMWSDAPADVDSESSYLRGAEDAARAILSVLEDPS